MVTRLGELVAGSRRRAAWTCLSWILLAGLLPMVTPAVDDVTEPGSANAAVAGAESGAARDLLLAEFPDQRGIPAVIVVSNPRGLTEADEAEVARITRDLQADGAPEALGRVVSITTMPALRPALMSPDGTTTTILVTVEGLNSTDERFGDVVREVRRIAGPGEGPRQVLLTGPAGIATDAVEVFRSADLVLLGLTVLLVLVILLVIYRAPLLALVPLVGVGIAMQVANATGAALADADLIRIDSSSTSIMTVLLFGAGTDYALFIVMRYREELRDASDRFAAMREALRRVGEPVLSSGGTVVLALLTLLLATVPATREFGPFLALGVLVMLLVSLTFVPAAVVLLGGGAFWPMRQAVRDPGERSIWGRVAALVLRRPVAVASGSVALLVVLATGLLGYAPNSDLISDFRAESDSRQGQELLGRAFPAGQLAPTSVLVRGPAATEDAARAAAAVRQVDGVSRVGVPVSSASGRVARFEVIHADDPYGSAALERTAQVRAVARGAAPAAEVLVGGESANALDNRTGDRRDYVVVALAMALLILLVLALLLRALVAPLVMLAATVLSLGSALGATVFTWVVLGGQPGTNNRVFLYTLIFLVALGVDYTILLASRIREETHRVGFPDGIRVALTRTGGVITSAGVILAGTFAVLMTQPLNSLLQFGFAMAVGILLDTFVVRGALLPALFRLIGPRIWYPGPLGRPGGGTTRVASPGAEDQRGDPRGASGPAAVGAPDGGA